MKNKEMLLIIVTIGLAFIIGVSVRGDRSKTTPAVTPTPAPNLAREIANKTINMPITGNVTIALYQNAAGEKCVEPLEYDRVHFLIWGSGLREWEGLYCSGEPHNIFTPEKIIGLYNNRIIWYSPGGEIYESQLKEKNRRISEEQYARSNPEWNLECIEHTCTLINTYNQTQVRYRVENISIVRTGKGEYKA